MAEADNQPLVAGGGRESAQVDQDLLGCVGEPLPASGEIHPTPVSEPGPTLQFPICGLGIVDWVEVSPKGRVV